MAWVEVRQGFETPPVAIYRFIAREAFRSWAAAVAMGQDGGHRHPPLVVVAGVLGLDRGLGGEADPLAAAVFAKTGDFKVALFKQARVGAILRVLHQ